MREFLFQYAFQNTPKQHTEKDSDNQATTADPIFNPLNMSWQDVSSEVSVMSENKRNSLCAEQLFAIYLRECSQLVNSNYYKQVV